MKTIQLLILGALILGINLPAYSYSTQDYKQITKITKEIRKLCDKGKIEEIEPYFSDSYRSFDGYGKKEMMKIFLAAHKLYPCSKTKEKVKKIEDQKDGIKIYIDETSKTKIKADDKNALYSNKKEVRGQLKSKSSYAMYYIKEDGMWKILKDEIFNEITEIRYGEAIKTDFEMSSPDSVAPGEEFTVKATVSVPKNRFAVGSIGHDKIIFPPEKYFDPYRAFPKNGVLERVMTANNEGINEYASSTFAFISAPDEMDAIDAAKNASVAGMGIFVKRINILKNRPL